MKNKSFDLTNQSIPKILLNHLSNWPEKVILETTSDGETIASSYSWKTLLERVQAFARLLLAEDAPRERVLIMLPQGDAFAIAFLGCIFANMIPVPVPLGGKDRNVQRLKSVSLSCEPKYAVTDAPGIDQFQALNQGNNKFPSVKIIEYSESILAGSNAKLGELSFDAEPEDTAFLQYSSGSTSDPKGVMVSHRNIADNAQLIAVGMELDSESVGFSWLPLFHDMGLIGMLLTPLLINFKTILMPTNAFLKNPTAWFKGISNFGGTYSGAPNFAYEVACRAIEGCGDAHLDLSKARVLYNGAEPIRYETINRVYQTFSRFGLPDGALFPCYGLAEATLYVCGTKVSKNEAVSKLGSGTCPVALGGTQGDCIVEVISETNQQCLLDKEIGEIVVRGTSVSKGYWNNPEESSRAFIRPKDRSGCYSLKTGDLGYMDQGRIVVTGRIKDTIIFNGNKIFPQDIEYCVQESSSIIQVGGVAALASMKRPGTIEIVVELKNSEGLKDAAALEATLRKRVLEVVGVSISLIHFVKKGTIPKTSSGKVQRSLLKTQINNMEIEALGPNSEIKNDLKPEHNNKATRLEVKKVDTSKSNKIAEIHSISPSKGKLNSPRKSQDNQEVFALLNSYLSKALEGVKVDSNTRISDLGMDSVVKTELNAVLMREFGTEIPTEAYSENLTLFQIAELLFRKQTSKVA
jgi:acyl-CoA synthetase (AMP-forming)/AMP-acid ligase II/acyl carrier protein